MLGATMKALPLSRCKNHHFSTASKRKRKSAVAPADGIEILPDEILIVILSCLSLKEAVRTSVLSHRWRHLWYFTSGTLEFDLDQWNAKKHLTDEIGATEFEILVNQVLKLHRGPSVDKFIIRSQRNWDRGSDTFCHSPNCICNWIHFAMQKDVRVLELYLLQDDHFPDLDKFLSISRAVKLQGIGLSSLTSLTLDHIHITEKMIEYLSSSYPSLEHLCLKYIRNIKHLNIEGPFLKSLIIHYCCSLEKLTISAANLGSFEFGDLHRSELPIEFRNVPVLSELTITGNCCSAFLFRNKQHSNYYNQLDKLVLRVSYGVIIQSSNYARFPSQDHPQLQCLKQLELILSSAADQSLFYFVLLIKECPLLSTFVVQFHYEYTVEEKSTSSALRGYGSKHVQAQLDSTRLEHLKVVKLMNFACYRNEVGFVLSLLQIAKALEKLIITPGPGYLGKRSKQLEAKLAPLTNLVIL